MSQVGVCGRMRQINGAQEVLRASSSLATWHSWKRSDRQQYGQIAFVAATAAATGLNTARACRR